MSVASIDQKPFLCDLCYEAFASLDTLKEHKHNKHPLRTDNDFLVCCHCKSVFTVEEELNEHLQVHNCKKLDPETGVGTHMFQKIVDTDQKPYVCNMCGAAFIDLDILVSHKEKHEEKFILEEDLNNQLENHKTPYSDMTASCNGITFDDDFYSKYHFVNMQSESTANPVSLNNVTAQQETKVKTEKDQMKAPSLPVSYQCDRCDKSFTQKLQLTYHIITHKYDKCKCGDCGKTFVTAKELKKHSCVVLHNNEDAKEESTTVKTTPSSARVHLEKQNSSDYLNLQRMWKDIHVKLENFSSQTRRRSESFENVASIEEPQEQQVVSRTRKRVAAQHETGNKTDFSKSHNGSMSNCKSGFTTANYNKQLYQCHRCRRSFPLKLQLTCHKIRHKYNMSKCTKSDKRWTPRSKNHLHGQIPERARKQLQGSRRKRQQKGRIFQPCGSPNMMNRNPSRHMNEKYLQIYGLSLRTKTFKRPFKCNQCDKAFTRKHHLTDHLGRHSGQMPFKCDQCHKTFAQKNYLFRHLKIHNEEKPFQCDLCHKTFKQRGYLFRHRKIHDDDKPFKCDQCDWAFTRKVQLNVHLRTHTGEKPFQCNQCNKAFTRKDHLIYHLRTHRGEKPFQCDQCQKRFTGKSDLTYHLKIHSGEKPFKCDECGKTFAVRYYLTHHLRTHSWNKPFKCDQCNKMFKQKSYLFQHRRTHTGTRPFKCDQCNKTFAMKHHLTAHNRTHTGKKEFICGQCNKGFSRKNYLFRHVRKHVEENPIKCEPYDDAFAEKSSLV